MNIEIITIGDELLLGFTVDTNAVEIAQSLSAIGASIVHRTTVGDDLESIVAAMRASLDRTGAVITTGGIGPTADDKTKLAAAAVFGRGLLVHEPTLLQLETRWLKRFGHEMPLSNRQQALMPIDAQILRNDYGSAPGALLTDEQGRWLVMLPGVPREMRGMLKDVVIPYIQQSAGDSSNVIVSHTLRTVGIAESALADRLGELAVNVHGLPVAFLPNENGVDLRITSYGRNSAATETVLRTAASAIRAKVGGFIYGENNDDLADIVLRMCVAAGLTISVAESCTGGMLGMRLSSVPGASAVLQGGTIAYDNSVKIRELGVSESDLRANGAVSESVAKAMARGVRTRFKTDIGVGITGIAGPGGATEEKPVGTVWVAVDFCGELHAVHARLPGVRSEIRWRATQLAFDRIRRRLEGVSEVDGWTTRG